MRRYAVFGVSGFGREVMPLVRNQLRNLPDPHELVFVDDGSSASEANGHLVLRYNDWISLPSVSHHISVAVADNKARQAIVERCSRDQVNFFEVRAKSMSEMDDVRIGEGAILCANVILTSNVKIGKHFHANIYSYVAHDCIIGDYVTFAPNVHCNGNIIVHDHAYIGTGAVLRQGEPGQPLVVGEGAVVGMGAVVTKDVPDGAVVVGNPARAIEKGLKNC